MVMRYEKVFRSLSKFVLHPLIHTFAFWGLGTKCWGKTLQVGTKHILPICLVLQMLRYDMEIGNFLPLRKLGAWLIQIYRLTFYGCQGFVLRQPTD